MTDSGKGPLRSQGTAVAPQGTAVAPQGTAAGDGVNASRAQVSGSEGRLEVQPDGKLMKIYNPGFRCNSPVLGLVQSLRGKGYVVDLYDFGTRDFPEGRLDFELMENCPLGSSDRYDLKGDRNAVLAIAVKTALSLDACHRAGFIHKDVKPANILIRNRETWDCVLCDFGIADVLDGGTVTTRQTRTPIYAAPEVYDSSNTIVLDGQTLCQLTPAADFYSLGMTILCLWYGEKSFLGKETELAIQKIKGAVKVPDDMPEPLRTMVRGLLVKDPGSRWGLGEIQRLLKGEKVPVAEGGLDIIFNGSKGRRARSIEELAACMASDRALAIKYLYGGKISGWLDAYPEVQVKIDQIVEKDFPSDRMMGLLAAIHTLNPLYDLNLCCDLDSPAYAMTGKSIGRVLNDAYNIWWSKYACDKDRMWKEYDDEDRSKVRGPDIVYALVSSFNSYSRNTYLPWFLSSKGSRFSDQERWFRYCMDFGSRDNRKKAGPKDAAYLSQTAMMKTIAGFGYRPVYDSPSTEMKGLRGWLAVQYHENPDVDLRPKYAYEKLLVKYLDEYRKYVPDCNEGRRFDYACGVAADTLKKAEDGTSDLRRRSILQRVLASLLAVVPALFLLVGIVSLIAGYPVVDLSGMKFSGLFSSIGLLLGVVVFFVSDSDSCLGSIILGLGASFLLFLLIRFLGSYITWIYGAAALGLIVFFAVKTVFAKNRNGGFSKADVKAGFEELTLEPLYYAFNSEKVFTSSLNRFIDTDGRDRLKAELDRRRKTIFIFVLVVWALLGVQIWLKDMLDVPDVNVKDMVEQIQENRVTEDE